jgi:hypothetical protein
MLSENEKRIQELSKELGECLYEQSQIKEFKGLGEIEETVRDLMLSYVSPEIGFFYPKKHRRKGWSSAKNKKYSGGITNNRKTS